MHVDFRAIVEGLADACFICDEDGLVIFANASARELLDADEDFFADNPADGWLYGEDGLLWPPSGERAERELTLAAGARTRRLHGRVAPLPVNGSMGWVIQLRRHDPAPDQLVGMRLVAGVVAQQLGQHLRTIIGGASQALMEHPDEAGASHLRAIHAAGQSAAGLQRQVQALGGGARPPEPFSLGSLLLDARQSLAALLGPGVTLHIDAEEDDGQLLGDADAMALLLAELAAWARDASPPVRQLSLRLERAGAEHVRLIHSDDGPGLDEDERAHLFEPSGGGRLGLALVFAVAARHGGRLLVEGTSGRGRRVVVELPGQPRVARKRRQREGGGETVLVVEDDPSVASWVERTLQTIGYTVHTAANGIAASVILRERGAEIDLLLTDAVLPGRSGPELIAEARTIPGGPRVLLMSGYSEDFLGEQATRGVQLLAKPFGPALLIQRVREVLDE